MKEQTINYQELFNHVSELPILALTVDARGGSDFFDSLLDGHEEILTFRGIWNFHQFWERSKFKDRDLKFLINEFTLEYSHKFEGKIFEMERWDKLGENQNESFSFDSFEFQQHLYNIFKVHTFNKKNFFIAIHIAYALVTRQNIYKTRLLFYHIHWKDAPKHFRVDFPDVKVLLMTRHPLNGLSSRIDFHPSDFNGKIECKGNIYEFQKLFNYVLRYVLCCHQGNLMKDDRVITLESLHANPEHILRSFCTEYNITYSPSLLKSTVHGKQWWGDTRTKSGNGFLQGFRSNADEPRWHGKFFWWEVLILETILHVKMNAYGYKTTFNITHKNSFVFRILANGLILLPMKYEIILMIRALIFAEGYNSKFRHFCYGLIQYIKRVLLLYTTLKKSTDECNTGKLYPQS
ncbi:MAG: hypothetical protein CVV30_02990 [Methanomicrobiales archaeon HGW-Methanomicrobiales-1]|jgi:hypothetical protein|nr:MAG: hypothetical protein CVV30_02990 [Methanomicrobiales archaeon HGW-Methanomicrobiales-1]